MDNIVTEDRKRMDNREIHSRNIQVMTCMTDRTTGVRGGRWAKCLYKSACVCVCGYDENCAVVFSNCADTNEMQQPHHNQRAASSFNDQNRGVEL